MNNQIQTSTDTLEKKKKKDDQNVYFHNRTYYYYFLLIHMVTWMCAEQKWSKLQIIWWMGYYVLTNAEACV